jgi:hypothetical protein
MAIFINKAQPLGNRRIGFGKQHHGIRKSTAQFLDMLHIILPDTNDLAGTDGILVENDISHHGLLGFFFGYPRPSAECAGLYASGSAGGIRQTGCRYPNLQ